MCSGVRNIVSAVIGAVKKVWNFIRKYLAILIVIVAIFFPLLWPMIAAYLPAAWVTAINAALAGSTVWGATSMFSWSALAIRGIVGLGFAYLIDSETAGDIVDKIGDVVGSVGGAIGGIIGGAVGGVASGLFSSPVGFLIIGGAALYFLTRKKDGDEEEEPRETPPAKLIESPLIPLDQVTIGANSAQVSQVAI